VKYWKKMNIQRHGGSILINHHRTSLTMAQHTRQLQQGMTLVELVVAVAVIIVLLAIGIPAVKEMTQSNRLSTEANKMLSSLLLTRSEAVKRQVDVGICLSTNGPAEADVGCTNNGTDPYRIIFADNDENGNWGAGDVLLRVEDSASGGRSWDVINNADYDPPTAQSIVFAPSGMPNEGKAFMLRLTDSSKTKCVLIEVSGRPSIATCP
jgi:prepilin-type N-terminal cleavage/methylation domain-containing protein